MFYHPSLIRISVILIQTQKHVNHLTAMHKLEQETSHQTTMVQRCRPGEQLRLIGHITDIPVVQWLTRRHCFHTQTRHIYDLTDLPVVQWLIKAPCVTEHTKHGRDVTHIPVIQRLVE